MSSDNGAANQTTIGFCMPYEENGVVLFGGLYGLILVPTEHFGQNDFAVGQWYSVRVQEPETDLTGYNFVSTSTPMPLDNYPFEVRCENGTVIARRVPVFIGHRAPENQWIGMNGFLGKVLVENPGLSQFRTYLFDLVADGSSEFACQWTSLKYCSAAQVQVPAQLVKAKYSSTMRQEDGTFYYVFIDEQGVPITVYERDITDRTVPIHESRELKIIRGAPLRWGYGSVCCFASTDVTFDMSHIQDLQPQFLQDNSDASSTVPDDPHGSRAEATNNAKLDATNEWLRKALALLAETLANPQTSSLIPDDVLERITTQLTYRSPASAQEPGV